MANTKLADLPSGAPAAGTDLVYTVKDPGGTPVDAKLTLNEVKTLVVGAGSVSVASGKTLTASNTLTLAGTDSTTMTFPATSATLARTDAGNTFTGSQTLSGGTVTTSSPLIDAAQTWNAGATTFTSLLLNVTDTASAVTSLLIDLQVGGSSRFNIDKTGLASVASAAGFAISTDVFLRRDAANTLAQRNGVNAQAFNIYNTFTDASNYERGFMRWVSNVLQIGTDKLGTGAARALAFQTDGVTRLTIQATGAVEAVSFVASANLFFGTTGQISSGRVRYSTPADGQVLFLNNASNNFDRMMFGGITSSFPAIKRSATTLQTRLADDTGFASIQGRLTTETAYTAGAPTAAGYLVLYDSNGTAYKVPAEAL
jgi:hypothetical protein